MDEHQGDRVGLGRRFVDEVDCLSFDLGGEMLEFVHLSLLFRPVEVVQPLNSKAIEDFRVNSCG